MTLQISNVQARHLILHLQGLTRPPHLRLGVEGLNDLIRQLGFVQVDSIQWVERAHHMILYARNQTYRPPHLKRLLERDRVLFENWTHDASLIPCAFYPYWLYKFERDREKLTAKFHQWQGDGYKEKCEALLRRIDQQGPLRSRDLDRPDGVKLAMWQWHDGKAALEFLWRTGALCITAREGFQKVYDLTERVIPSHQLDKMPSHEDFVDWACRSALRRLGFGTPGDIARFWDLISIKEASDWAARQTDNTLISVDVEGARKGDIKSTLARADIASLVDALPPLPKRVRTLSPFDPVIRDRKRLEWLFNFQYRIEIYVPEEKRQWGYYVFPLLEGNRLIGRIDMRARRKESVLEVKRLWLEPRVKLSDSRRERIDAELIRQARLCKMKDVTWMDGAFAGE